MDYFRERKEKRKAKPAPTGRIRNALHRIVNFLCFCIVGSTDNQDETYGPSNNNEEEIPPSKITKKVQPFNVRKARSELNLTRGHEEQNNNLKRMTSWMSLPLPKLPEKKAAVHRLSLMQCTVPDSSLDRRSLLPIKPTSRISLASTAKLSGGSTVNVCYPIKRPLSLGNIRNEVEASDEELLPEMFAAARSTKHPPIMKRITDFNLIQVLGRGGFGKVLLCELKGKNQFFAIKALKKSEVVADNDLENVLVEKRILTLATCHPFLTKIYSAFQSREHLFLVMEYLSGGSLFFHLELCGIFDENRSRFYAAEIICGLQFLHKLGIIYRDLKLENTMLDSQGHIKLADFGLCKEDISEDKKASTVCGTTSYMAPEILKKQKYDFAVDWWSFGVLLYEMITGVSPFDEDTEKELCRAICQDKVDYPLWLSAEAVHCLTQLLDRCPTNRLGYKLGTNPNIRSHAFFKNVDWWKLEGRKIEPPYKPVLRDFRDTSYSDPEFTMDPPTFTPTKKELIESMDQEQFRGFSFVNPYFDD